MRKTQHEGRVAIGLDQVLVRPLDDALVSGNCIGPADFPNPWEFATSAGILGFKWPWGSIR
jgi:hypothetical protein